MRRLLLLVLPLVLDACSSSGLAPLEPPATLSPLRAELAVKHLWSHQLDGGVGHQFVRLPPLVDGDRVYQVALNGEVAAYRSATGDRLWHRELHRPVEAGPGDGGTSLLLGSDNEVLALAKTDGKVLWRQQVSSEVLAAPVRSGDTVLVRTIDGGLYALSADDGHQLWDYEGQQVPALSLRGQSQPLVVDGTVIAGFANGRVAAVGLDDGKVRWDTEVAPPRGRSEIERLVDLDANPVADGGLVFVASYQGKLSALATSNGQIVWSRDIGSYSGLTLSEGILYLSDDHGVVWALSARNGATLWRQDVLHGRRLTQPVSEGDYLVVGDYQGYLHWLSIEDGRLVARTRVREPAAYFPVKDQYYEKDTVSDRGILAPPVVVGGRVYGVDKRGVLDVFAVRPLKSGGSAGEAQ